MSNQSPKPQRFLIASACVASVLLSAAPVFAQGMMGRNYGYAPTATAPTSADASATAQDEAAGKAIWERLQAKQASCADLKDDDFDKLGDYFMGLMMGSAHAVMNAQMQSRLGEAGERQMHVVMGKRLSGCDTNAAYPQGYGLSSMMGGYGGYPATDVGYWITNGLVWILLALGIFALAKLILKRK